MTTENESPELSWSQIIRAATMLGYKEREKGKAGAFMIRKRLLAQIDAGNVEQIGRGRYRLIGDFTDAEAEEIAEEMADERFGGVKAP